MSTRLRYAKIAAAVAALLIGTTLAMAAKTDKSPAKNKAKTPQAKKENVEHYAYLGVGIERLNPAFASHMPKIFHNGQGVLVSSVIKGSPADKAGIKPQDVLMTYDNQKLFSPYQLARLVRADKVGRKVGLTIVHQGKSEHVRVTLGENKRETAGRLGEFFPQMPPWARRMPQWRMPQWQVPQGFVHPTSPKANEKGWESFDSLSIKNLGHNRFSAEIRYLGKDGKMVDHKYEGTRQQLQKDINTSKDLPRIERTQLLRSLNLPVKGEFSIPEGYVFPSSGSPGNFNSYWPF
jgi:hypothetical protein